MSAQNKDKVGKKTIRVTLAPGDAEYIAELAADLKISQTEVLRKGLKLMAAYKKAKEENSTFVIENEEQNTRKELIIL